MVVSTTTGTGTYTLGATILGYQSFSVVGNGNSCYYAAYQCDGSGTPVSGGWETGIGTFTLAGTLLSRDSIIESSNANAAVNWPAGTRRIFIAPLSALFSGSADGNVFRRSGSTFGMGALNLAGGAAAVIGVLPVPNGGGIIIQIARTETGAVATGTTIIPLDDTIPQITEGNEYMTLAMTPTSAASILRIDVVSHSGNTAASTFNITALFQDAVANALACGVQYIDVATALSGVRFTHYMAAGTTSPITFRVRVGGHQSGTTTFNGTAAARKFGGVLASSITVTEFRP
jgi:hypothetical protein